MNKHLISNKLKHLIFFALSLGMVSFLPSCDSAKEIDYAHNGCCQLKLDYQNHDFLVDGIGQVNVKTYIDGDTTHFNNVFGDKNTIIKSRYYGIDTPESTGNIQEYGKQASNFTHEILARAAENGTIVVSSPFSIAEDGGPGVYQVPKTDSTGGRYLSLVWVNETVKNAPVESLSLLNLYIVQKGLSWAKNTSEVPAFSDIFSKAQKQAEKLKYKLWSGEADPLFNYGEYQSISLLDIKEETLKFFHDTSYENAFSGANVRFTGVVSGYSNHNLYVQEYYPDDPDKPEEGGQWAGINLFCGMSAISSIYTKVGTYLQLVGKASNSETFGFQIGDMQGHFPPSPSTDESDVQILLSAEENVGIHSIKTFEYSPSQLNQNIDSLEFDNLFCRTKVTMPLTCSDAYVNSDGDEVTLSFEGCDFSAYIPFTYHGNPNDPGDTWMIADKFIGKTFELSGVFTYHKSGSNVKFQIVVCGDSDLVCLTPSKGTVSAEPYTVSEAVENVDTTIPNVTYYLNGKIGEVYEASNEEAYSQEAIEKTFSEAFDIGDELQNGTETSDLYRVTGKVKSITSAWSSIYKNATFVLESLDSSYSNTIQCYRVGVASGVNISNINVGSKITIEGKISKFNSTVEFGAESKVVNHLPLGAVSFTLVQDSDVVYVENASLPDSIINKSYSSDNERSTAISEYLTSVISGSIVHLKGIPELVDDKVYYNNATILVTYLHGQIEEDPLTITEADNIAENLQVDGLSPIYYFKGEIKEIVSEYNVSNKRMTIKLTDGTTDYLVTDLRIINTIDYADLTVGKQIVVSSKLTKIEVKDGETTTYLKTTYSNGCKIVKIIEE